jgi:hypothetical protein
LAELVEIPEDVYRNSGIFRQRRLKEIFRDEQD